MLDSKTMEKLKMYNIEKVTEIKVDYQYKGYTEFANIKEVDFEEKYFIEFWEGRKLERYLTGLENIYCNNFDMEHAFKSKEYSIKDIESCKFYRKEDRVITSDRGYYYYWKINERTDFKACKDYIVEVIYSYNTLMCINYYVKEDGKYKLHNTAVSRTCIDYMPSEDDLYRKYRDWQSVEFYYRKKRIPPYSTTTWKHLRYFTRLNRPMCELLGETKEWERD